MKIQHYRQSRNVPKLSLVPGKLREKMLRNCIRFEVAVYKDDNHFVFKQDIETAVDQHTSKLYHLDVQMDSHPMSSTSLMYVSIFFEKYEDMERFQKHFMLLHKLSN